MGAALVALVMVAMAAWGAAALWQAATRPAETRVPTTRDCDDGDPCTIDFWHEFRDQCVHAADPLCTRACEADTDCTFDPEIAPCIVGTCSEGQCSFVELAEADCQTCAADADCPDDFCSPVTCTDGRCRHGERDCDDGDPTTWDRCSVEAQACEHLLADGVRSCAVPEDCASDHPCERFDCVAGRCTVTAETAGCGEALDVVRVCYPANGNRECIQAGGDVCVAGPCEDSFAGGARSRTPPIALREGDRKRRQLLPLTRLHGDGLRRRGGPLLPGPQPRDGRRVLGRPQTCHPGRDPSPPRDRRLTTASGRRGPL